MLNSNDTIYGSCFSIDVTLAKELMLKDVCELVAIQETLK